jgi:hypothetical protein
MHSNTNGGSDEGVEDN